MKLIALTSIFLLTLTSKSFAENWMARSKILSSSVEAHQLKAECERVSGEECFDVAASPSSVYEGYIAKVGTQECVDADDCQAKLEQIVCSNIEEAIKNLDDLEVYCAHPSIRVNESALAAHEAAQAAAAQLLIDRAAALQAVRESGMAKLMASQALTAVEAKVMMGLAVTDEELGL